jgi:hypothetical protein
MIPESDIQKALDWLLKEAVPAANARADRLDLEEFTKVIKAEEMKKSSGSSAAAREMDALASEAYKVHLRGLKEAVAEDERYRRLAEVAQARIEVWRTLCSNARIQAKI